jgi:hypothetical protein
MKRDPFSNHNSDLLISNFVDGYLREYHKSWDLLIPVAKRIIDSFDKNYLIPLDRNGAHTITYLMESAKDLSFHDMYHQTCMFIKWYNNRLNTYRKVRVVNVDNLTDKALNKIEVVMYCSADFIEEDEELSTIYNTKGQSLTIPTNRLEDVK